MTSKRSSIGKRPTKRTPAKPRPTADLGHQIRTLRKAAGLTHDVIARKMHMRAPQMSLIETGHNVQSQFYARVATALGFRGALEMFRASDSDPLRKQLDRAWLLLDDAQKKRALRFLNTLLIEG